MPLTYTGQHLMLSTFFQGANPGTTFYAGLCGGTPGLGTTLTDVAAVEPTPGVNGYNRKAIMRSSASDGFPSLTKPDNWCAESCTVSFTASGGPIGPVSYAFLCTSSDNSGTLIEYIPLSATVTLSAGESLDVTFREKQS